MPECRGRKKTVLMFKGGLANGGGKTKVKDRERKEKEGFMGLQQMFAVL